MVEIYKPGDIFLPLIAYGSIFIHFYTASRGKSYRIRQCVTPSTAYKVRRKT